MEALVEYNYEAQESDELTIRKGDVIKDVKVLNGGWWEGTLRDKRGMFPDNFVKILDPPGGRNSGDKKHEEVTLRNGSGRKYCRVLFSYEPCNDDELKLIPEDSIEYLGEVEEGWWRGRVKGRIGVFPSNFVSAPVPEEAERIKDKKEYCRVLFPYDAANEDELTLVEGDIITLLSKDAPDKGWWKGELKGQIGLFPDNFVELVSVKNDQFPDPQPNQGSTIKSLSKYQHGKRKETANVRKSLDTRNARTDSSLKKMTTSSSSSSLSGSTGEKKTSTIISSLKRLVGDGTSTTSTITTTNNNGTAIAGSGLGSLSTEELDEVERGEGAPLSHLTASRAKAPRRRLPSTQHLRYHAPTGTNNTSSVIVEDSMTNGSSENVEPLVKEDENDGNAKSRRMAPWVEELKLNQMERRKMGIERVEKEVKKERTSYPWMPPVTNNTDTSPKQDLDGEELKSKEKETEKEREKEKEKEKPSRLEISPPAEQPASSPVLNTPAYVPYYLYSQLLDRIAVLEEKQTVLQRKVNQLSDQLAPFLANAASDKD